MGNSVADSVRKARWKGYYDETKRKILVLTFKENDIKQLSKLIVGKEVEVDEDIGFLCEDVNYKKMLFKYWVCILL